MLGSNIPVNQTGYISDGQRQRLRMRSYLRLAVPVILVVLIILSFSNKPTTRTTTVRGTTRTTTSNGSEIFFALLFAAVFTLDLPQSVRILQDVRDGVVSKDCGKLSFAAYTGRFGYSLVWIDNERSYRWNKGIEGGFESGEEGCVYFLPHSRFVVSIHTDS